MFNLEFYPTPPSLVSAVKSKIDWRFVNLVLEPSAGKGDLADMATRSSYTIKEDKIHVIEIDVNLRSILKSKGYNLVYDDFLSFKSFSEYDLIVMNPPFSNGDQHLLKAIDVMSSGGQIVCILNAETIRNPYTNRRKELAKRLSSLSADITYLSSEFSTAERKTDVEIALIYIKMDKDSYESDLLKNLKKSTRMDDEEYYSTDVTSGDITDSLVRMYEFEAQAGLKIINEYNALMPYLSSNVDGKNPILELKVNESRYDIKNSFISRLRLKYWKTLFSSPKFTAMFTGKERHKYQEKVQELSEYEFTKSNITQVQIDLSGTAIDQLNKSIVDLFDEFSSKYYDEYSKNIHYYNGWKTNKAWKINNKVITRLNAYGNYNSGYQPHYEVAEKILDIEKVFAYLDGKIHNDYSYVDDTLKSSRDGDKDIKLKYISVTFYKKGTTHIKFLDNNLLKKFNIIGSQSKGWLPPNYGNSSYDDCSDDMKSVIAEFEGAGSYKDTSVNNSFYRLNEAGDITKFLN